MEENTTNNEQTATPDNTPAENTAPAAASNPIAELEAQVSSLKDQLLRKAAEFENFKRRKEQESLTFIKYAGENIILDILPVVDDLSRSLKSGKEKLADDPFYKGVELILAKFLKSLEAQGVKPMESIGKEFNVDFHDVMMQMPKADVAPHTIIDEIEKGYFLHDKVIRHAKVIVATSPAAEEVKD